MALNFVQKVHALCPDIPNKGDWQGVEIRDIGKGSFFHKWTHSKYSQPTQEQIDAVTQEDYDKNVITYKNNRVEEYPSVLAQLDLLYHQGYDGWKAEIKKIKDKYPKQGL